MSGTRGFVVLVAVLGAALAIAGRAAADDGDREIRKSGSCTGSSAASLRLRVENDEIELELEIETKRRAGRWEGIILHERRIVFRGIVPRSGGRSVRLRKSLRNWYGSETVTVRAYGPRAETCRVSATV